MLGKEQLQAHVAIGDHPAIAVMGMADRLLDPLADGLVAHLGLQHLLLVVPQEVVLHVGLDRLGERLVFAGLEEAGDGRGERFLEHDIRALPLEEPVGIVRDGLLAILEGERKGAVDDPRAPPA